MSDRSARIVRRTPTRTFALWCPAWAVVTARCVDPALAGVPVAVVERGKRGLVVRAASTEARAEGVTVGLRRREAESRCAGLMVVDADLAAEARAFEAVARAMDPITPGIVLERPGVLTFPTRGPSRYFGGDDALSVRVLDAVASTGITSARAGVADGSFAARLAARTAGPGGTRIVAPDGSSAFLAPWPVGVLRGAVGAGDAAKPWLDGREGGAKSTRAGDAAKPWLDGREGGAKSTRAGDAAKPWLDGREGGAKSTRAGDDLVSLLVRLGLPTLGDFAALPAPSVLARFGIDGARAHRLALGLDEHAAPPAPPPPDLVETCELDPPATRVDEAAFAAKGLADRLLARLEALGLACTQVVVEAETEHGEHLTRCWRHEGALTPAALVARVRWQLDGWLTGAASVCEPGIPGRGERDHRWEGGLSGGLTLVRLAPDRIVPAVARQLGFWGGDAAAHDRADRALARLQGMLGHDGVVTAVVTGGRAPSERVRWVPWGEPRDDRDAPGAEVPAWPGAIPGPAPARVHVPPLPADLLDAEGAPLVVSGRGEASAAPAHLRCDALPDGGGAVTAWAGPWAHDLRWWDRVTRRRRALWQVVVGDDDAQVACLVVVESGRAGVEAIYD